MADTGPKNELELLFFDTFSHENAEVSETRTISNWQIFHCKIYVMQFLFLLSLHTIRSIYFHFGDFRMCQITQLDLIVFVLFFTLM